GVTQHPSLLLFTATSAPLFYTLSLHDALPILKLPRVAAGRGTWRSSSRAPIAGRGASTPITATGTSVRSRISYVPGLTRRSISRDRKSTRLNSSHLVISYAVFCLKKKIKQAQ